MHWKSSGFSQVVSRLSISTNFCFEDSAALFCWYRLPILRPNIPAKPMTASVDTLKSCGFFIAFKKWALA